MAAWPSSKVSRDGCLTLDLGSQGLSPEKKCLGWQFSPVDERPMSVYIQGHNLLTLCSVVWQELGKPKLNKQLWRQLLEFKSWLCPFLAMWFGANYWVSVCLSFCICTMEIIIKLSLLDCNKNGIIVNGIVQCLAHNKGSINISDYDNNNNFIIDIHQREKVIYVSKKIWIVILITALFSIVAGWKPSKCLSIENS